MGNSLGKPLLGRRQMVGGLLAGLSCSVANLGRAQVPDFKHLPPEQRLQAEATVARMMAALPYERAVVPGVTVFAELQKLRSLGKGWPVAIGDDDALLRIAEQYSIADPEVFGSALASVGLPSPRSPAEVLAAAAALSFPQDLALWSGAYAPEDLQAPVGDWPNLSPDEIALPPLVSVAYDILKRKPFDQVHVLFIPTDKSWEVPAFLRWGDWNACPPPEYHVAALHRWHDAYGAELVGINGDRMDLSVERPPSDKDEALAVAKEIYRYCPDDVDQGTGTLALLAASMVMQHSWQFWWD